MEPSVTGSRHTGTPRLTSLQDMSVEEFNEIVSADVKGELEHRDRARAAALREPDNVERWFEALAELIRSVDFQFSASKAEAFQHRREFLTHAASTAAGHEAYEAYYEGVLNWKKSTMRFRREAQKRLDEARLLRREVRSRAPASIAYHLMTAIEAHWQASHHDGEGGDIPDLDEADTQLWQAWEQAKVTLES